MITYQNLNTSKCLLLQYLIVVLQAASQVLSVPICDSVTLRVSCVLMWRLFRDAFKFSFPSLLKH
jgi:hypothetical protein